MQYMPSSNFLASPFECPSVPVETVIVTPAALLAAFASVPDPRRAQGTRFSLAAILALAVASILSNHLSVLAIAEWGADQSHDLLRALGFTGKTTPRQSTIQRLFKKLSPDRLVAALSNCFDKEGVEPARRPRGSQGVAIDGKAQRGRLSFDHSGCPVHALSAFLHDYEVVLATETIEAHGPTDKAEAELTVAPALIEHIDWQGRVLTGDALFCQRKLCQQVLDAGGDYLLAVKENQAKLYDDIRLLFDPPFKALPLDDRREAQSVDHGHGRHNDIRRLVASTDLVGYSNWPGLAQVFRLERTWQERGQAKGEVRYGITSLPPDVANADRLLRLNRGHWQIENGLHYVKDVTLGEDRSLIHVGNGASIMSILRGVAISVLHENGYRTIAQCLRSNSRNPLRVLSLLNAPPS